MGNSHNTFAETKHEQDAEGDCERGREKKAIYFRPAAPRERREGEAETGAGKSNIVFYGVLCCKTAQLCVTRCDC